MADLPDRRIRPRKPGTLRGKPAQNARKNEPSKRLSVLYRGSLDKLSETGPSLFITRIGTRPSFCELLEPFL
ncbi:hypothetical protein GAS19_05805 [Burkholderia glumae]|nr:hypothetical protein CEQ24_018655 [Burkholderia glumae]QGA37229.1 hypothetical protein GAS19_05805 [Burkholderia glumae]UVS90806.1 hypothetical protein EFP17_14130 [Burkholderia glumae]UVT04248.1 hypothetical protein EFP20_23350 [Burkholderia glumae]